MRYDQYANQCNPIFGVGGVGVGGGGMNDVDENSGPWYHFS